MFDTANRELYEKTGAMGYDICSIYVYSVTAPYNFEGRGIYGMLYYANYRKFKDELHNKIEKIVFTDEPT